MKEYAVKPKLLDFQSYLKYRDKKKAEEKDMAMMREVLLFVRDDQARKSVEDYCEWIESNGQNYRIVSLTQEIKLFAAYVSVSYANT